MGTFEDPQSPAGSAQPQPDSPWYGPQGPAGPPGPPAALRVGHGMAMLVAALGTTSCAAFQNAPPSTPADIENAVACVTAAVLSGSNLGGCIAQYGPALVADAIQMLLHSKQFTAEHPELRGTLEARKAELKYNQ